MQFFGLGACFCTDGSEFYFEPDEPLSLGQPPKCDTCGVVYGMLPLIPPVKGTLVANKRLFDVASTVANELLLSRRSWDVFSNYDLKGIKAPIPIQLTRIDGPKRLQNLRCEYLLARVERWGAEIDRVGSGIQTTESTVCPTCGYAGIIQGYERIRILDESWNGSDLFTVKGLPMLLATQRVVDICHEFGLAVCSLLPAELLRMPVVPTVSDRGDSE